MSASRQDYDEWTNRLNYHPADTQHKREGHELVRTAFEAVGELMLTIMAPGRYRTLVLTALEEGAMWANRGLAVGGGPERGTADQEAATAATNQLLDHWERFAESNPEPETSAEPPSRYHANISSLEVIAYVGDGTAAVRWTEKGEMKVKSFLPGELESAASMFLTAAKLVRHNPQ